MGLYVNVLPYVLPSLAFLMFGSPCRCVNGSDMNVYFESEIDLRAKFDEDPEKNG